MAIAPIAAGRTRVVLSPTANCLAGLGILSLLIWLPTERPAFVALAFVLLAGVAADAALGWWALRNLRVDLQAPADVASGVPSRWDVHLTGWKRPFAMRPLLFPVPVDQLLEGSQPAALMWPAMTRGVVPFVAYDVMARGPLGLATAGRRMVQELEQPLHVGPVPVEVDVRWPRPIPVGFGTVEGAPVGEELFRAIRPYRRGDSRRKVSWKATAHHGQLMVVERDGTGAVRVRIVVELPPDPWGADHAAGIATTMALDAMRRGWQVELVTLDGGVLPTITSPGRVFGAPPVVGMTMPQYRTVAAPIRSAHDIRQRLARATPGRPQVDARRSTAGHTCWVNAGGVSWT